MTNTGISISWHFSAKATDNSFAPMIKIPGCLDVANPNFCASGLSVNQCAQTVKKTSANVNAVRMPASSYPSSNSNSAKYPATVNATIPLGAIQETSVFSFNVNSVPIVASQMEAGLTIKSITTTKAMTDTERTWPMTSLDNEDVNKMKTVDVRSTEAFSTKSPVPPMDATIFLVRASVNPMTVTASIPVSCIAISLMVKQIKINDSKIGDFKNSGSFSFPINTLITSPAPSPRTVAPSAQRKKNNK